MSYYYTTVTACRADEKTFHSKKAVLAKVEHGKMVRQYTQGGNYVATLRVVITDTVSKLVKV